MVSRQLLIEVCVRLMEMLSKARHLREKITAHSIAHGTAAVYYIARHINFKSDT